APIDANPEYVHLVLARVSALQRTDEPMAHDLQQVTECLAGIPAATDRLDQLLEMPQKQVAANLAPRPAAERDQAQRLIDAAADGTHHRRRDRRSDS
ncbi:hypothetical protein ACFXKJ_41185, partial [Kitasatospora indigofera]|uniref:hypothetical protein n=1 Tax=Kitasatospora indigofera TaxID=67307 RepID=UPI0036CC093E